LSTLTYCSLVTVLTMAWRNPPTWQMAALCTSCMVSKNIYHHTERQYPGTYIGLNGYILLQKILFLWWCHRQNLTLHLCGTNCALNCPIFIWCHVALTLCLHAIWIKINISVACHTFSMCTWCKKCKILTLKSFYKLLWHPT